MQISARNRLVLRAYFAVLAICGAGILAAFDANGAWMRLPDGRPRITDFAEFWAAGKQIRYGHAPSIYDMAQHISLQGRLLGQAPVYGLAYPYPPSSLLFVWPLGWLDYLTAWSLFVAFGALAWLAVLKAITRDWLLAALMALCAGGATYSVLLGQNGFYTAALLCGGLVLLPSRKILAGTLIGLLTFKPHMAMVAFLALLMWREWKALGASVATVAVLSAITIPLWGVEIWAAFLDGTVRQADMITQSLAHIAVTKGQSVAEIFTPWLGLQKAMAMQLAAALIANALVWRLCKAEQRTAAVVCATLLTTPYSFLYDLTALTGAAAFLLRNHPRWDEICAILVALALPPLWFLIWAPVGPVPALILLGVAYLQGIRSEASVIAGRGHPPSGPAQGGKL